MSLTLLGACSSASKGIARSATAANNAAVVISNGQAEIISTTNFLTETYPEDQLIRDSAAEIKVHAEESLRQAALVRRSADSISHDVTQVKDITPWWASLAARIAGAVAILGVIFLLFYTGAWRLIAVGVQWISAMIPNPKKDDEVRTLMRINEEAPSRQSDIAIAAKRADPVFDKKWKIQKKKQDRGSSSGG